MTEIIARFRQVDGAARVIERALLVLLAVAGSLWATQVHHYLPFAFFNEQYLGLFLGLGLAPVFLIVRASPRAPLPRVPWYDWLGCAGALVVGGYVTVFYPSMAYSLGALSWDRLLLGGLTLVLVVVDGAITIPMMKRSGYPAHLAAAIEAVASNGGQIMPPVMGAAAFLIAEYLSIPYGEVALAALIPACLYYLALFVQVDLEAAKNGIVGLPRRQLPRIGDIMRRGWVFLVPLLSLLYTLMLANWDAGKAGMLAVVTTFLVVTLQKEPRPPCRGIVGSLEGTGRTVLDL